ncbi:hypothetical protein ID0469_04810 [Helicobacter pylori]
MPKWGDLINELQKCLYGDIKKNENYLVLAEKFYNQFGESFYYQTLKSLIPDSAKRNDLHNVKQIISWVNSHSKSVKPIYFIKTAKEFDRIEFEFYKNKNIHILYTQEHSGKQGHYEELIKFLKEIKAKLTDISKNYNAIFSSTKQLRRMIFNFDYEAMKKRISEISLKNFSVLNELEKAFLFYHLRKSIQAFEVLKITSKQAFRERNYDFWYISLYDMHNMPLPYDRFDDKEMERLQTYHKERISIDLNESFYELPFYKRGQLKYLRDIWHHTRY